MSEGRFYTEWGDIPAPYERPEDYGDYPPLTAEEMRGIAEYLEAYKGPNSYKRIEEAQLWWLDKASEADRQALSQQYEDVSGAVQEALDL